MKAEDVAPPSTHWNRSGTGGTRRRRRRPCGSQRVRPSQFTPTFRVRGVGRRLQTPKENGEVKGGKRLFAWTTDTCTCDP